MDLNWIKKCHSRKITLRSISNKSTTMVLSSNNTTNNSKHKCSNKLSKKQPNIWPNAFIPAWSMKASQQPKYKTKMPQFLKNSPKTLCQIHLVLSSSSNSRHSKNHNKLSGLLISHHSCQINSKISLRPHKRDSSKTTPFKIIKMWAISKQQVPFIINHNFRWMYRKAMKQTLCQIKIRLIINSK